MVSLLCYYLFFSLKTSLFPLMHYKVVLFHCLLVNKRNREFCCFTVVRLFNNIMNCFLPCMLADTASQTIGQCGGVKAVITTMRLFSHQVDIVTPCCNALWTLAVSGKRATISCPFISGSSLWDEDFGFYCDLFIHL